MKTIKRFMPISIYDITQVEAYLMHMAAKGYFIKKIGIFATFEDGIPEKAIYRLEPFGDKQKEPPEDMLLHFEEQGWEYICTAGFFHIYKATRDDVTEIHTDPITQGETFAYLNKKLKFLFLLITGLYIFSGGMLFLASFFHDQPIYFNVRYSGLTLKVTLIALYVITIYNSLQDYKKIKKLKNQLELGIRMCHSKKYKPRYGQYVSFFLPLLLLIPMFWVQYYDGKAHWEKSLLEYEGKLPTIPLSSLETNPEFTIVYGDEDNRSYNNTITHHWTELAPKIYIVEERGEIAGQMWRDGSGTYSPSMDTEFYELRFKLLTKPLFEELIEDKNELYRYEKMEYEELLDTGFDQATLISREACQMFFGRTGKKVIFIQYYGHKDLGAMVEQIFTTINNFDGD